MGNKYKYQWSTDIQQSYQYQLTGKNALQQILIWKHRYLLLLLLCKIWTRNWHKRSKQILLVCLWGFSLSTLGFVEITNADRNWGLEVVLLSKCSYHWQSLVQQANIATYLKNYNIIKIMYSCRLEYIWNR